MVSTFEEILKKKSIFKDRTVLSPHYIPDVLPYREKYIEEIMKTLAPALKGQKPKNTFIYGKTATGKTSTIKYIMKDFTATAEKMKCESIIRYINCRMYNSRYRVMQKLLKEFFPEVEKAGYGVTYFYEKLIELLSKGKQVIVVLDEIDMIKDLDDLVYTFTRVNDELESKKGGLTIVGISNKLDFKSMLDPRSRSSLYETELVFPPYDSIQIKGILKQRIELGFEKDVVTPGALNYISAITAQESGDARYGLKLLLKAGDVAENLNKDKIEVEDVDRARALVDYDLAAEAISTLPPNHQLVLYTIAKLTLKKQTKLFSNTNDNDTYLFSGDVYENYVKISKFFGKKPKSARWYRQYINELEMLGLISTLFTGKGIRGHTKVIKIGHNPNDVISIINKNLGMQTR